MFCRKNRIKIKVLFHKMYSNCRTIEFHADLKKNNKDIEFFMSFDSEWLLSRFEVKYNKVVKKFKSLEDCLSWILGVSYI